MSYQTDEPCAATGRVDVQRTSHHLYSRGSRPDLKDCAWNKIPLTMMQHTEIHQIGLNRFAERYPSVKEWLINNGWEFDVFSNKWIHEGATR